MRQALQPVLARYRWLAAPAASALGVRGGFSGAQVFEVGDGPARFCLKRWPADGMTAPRLVAIHALLRQARAAGVTFLPEPIAARDGSTVIEHDGLWDVCTWVPGSADLQGDTSPPRLKAACAALAHLHTAWIPPMPRRGPCPGVQRRWQALEVWQTLVASGWRPAWSADDPVRTCAQRAWRLLPARVAAARGELAPWRSVEGALQPCWCDPWRAHVLFTGDRVTGLVDHGSVKEDHPAVDLARLLGSFHGSHVHRWQAGLEAYRAVRPLAAREELLIPLLERTGLVVAAANWLRWLYHEGRTFADRAAAAARLAGLVEELDGYDAPR